MNRLLVVMSVTVVLLVGVVGLAAGQDGGLAGLIQPLVVDVEQAVPVEVLLAVPVGEGEVMTVTAPITVHVRLRVSIDGPQVVTVEPLPAEEVAITVEAVEEDPADLVDTRGLAYEVESTDDIEVLQVQSLEGGLGLQIVAELQNNSDGPMDYVQVVASLYDAEGNLIDVAIGYAALETIDAGQTSPAQVLSMVDASLVASYLVQVKE